MQLSRGYVFTFLDCIFLYSYQYKYIKYEQDSRASGEVIHFELILKDATLGRKVRGCFLHVDDP